MNGPDSEEVFKAMDEMFALAKWDGCKHSYDMPEDDPDAWATVRLECKHCQAVLFVGNREGALEVCRQTKG